MCVCDVGVFVCSRETTNSTVVDRELTPWFLRSVDDLVWEERDRFEEIPGTVDGF